MSRGMFKQLLQDLDSFITSFLSFARISQTALCKNCNFNCQRSLWAAKQCYLLIGLRMTCDPIIGLSDWPSHIRSRYSGGRLSGVNMRAFGPNSKDLHSRFWEFSMTIGINVLYIGIRYRIYAVWCIICLLKFGSPVGGHLGLCRRQLKYELDSPWSTGFLLSYPKRNKLYVVELSCVQEWKLQVLGLNWKSRVTRTRLRYS